MPSSDMSTIDQILQHGPHLSEIARKQLTLAFGGLYIASTSLSTKPLLVWEESAKSYPRYYIPVKSLHPELRKQLENSDASQDHKTNGTEHTVPSARVEVIETLKGKDGQAKALIEKVTVDSKSTTWVRFLQGDLTDFIRFEFKEIDAAFENGTIITSVKRPNHRIDTATVSNHIVVKIDGEEVADTNAAVLLNETGLGETYYLPATSIKNWGSVEKSSLKTTCPYKGEASYLSISANGKRYEDFIWYYQYPLHEAAAVQGMVSFYKKPNVDILVDGVRI